MPNAPRLFLFAALALAACAQPAASAPEKTPSPAPVTGSPVAQQIRAELARLDAELRAPGAFAAGLNETADLGNGLTVTPLQVLEDSRCPADVVCVWAGRLRLRANVSGEDVEMTLGQATQTTHDAVLFAIAKPTPFASWPENEVGPRPAYLFGFRRD